METNDTVEQPAESSPPPPRKVVKIKRFQIGLNVLVQLLVLTAIAIAVNYISFRHFKRWDLSRDQKFALASQTTNLLKNLHKPVKAIVFFNVASPMAGQIYGDVLGLLKEYEYASDQKLTVEIVDPYRNLTRARDLAKQYNFGANESIVVLDYDGRSKFVNATDLVEMDMGNPMMGMPPEIKAFKGESVLTSTLMQLIEEKQKKVYFVTGHGEPGVESEEISTFRDHLKRQNIGMADLKLHDVDAIPEDASALMVFGPKVDYSELEVKRLDDYWKKNGRLMILLDPEARTLRLNGWLVSVGVTPQGDYVLRIGKVFTQDASGRPALQNAVILSPTGEILPQSTSITRDLAGIDMPFFDATESLAIEQSQEQIQKLTFTKLVETPEDVWWGETAFTRGENKPVMFNPEVDHKGPLTLAVVVERGAMTDPRVDVETGRMSIFGNAAFLTDDGIRNSDVGLDLALNTLNWSLNRQETTAGIAPKEKKAVSLSLSEEQIRNLALALMLGIPGVVAIFGIIICWVRRS